MHCCIEHFFLAMRKSQKVLAEVVFLAPFEPVLESTIETLWLNALLNRATAL